MFGIPKVGIFREKFDIKPKMENINIKKKLNDVIFHIFFNVRNLFFVAIS